MGKHFVTVCVFCLLCATHSPCSSHVQFSSNEKKFDDGQISVVSDPNKLPVKKTVFEKITDRYSPPDNFPLNDSESIDSLSLNNEPNIKNKTRTKRDVNKKHNFDEALYIEKIFNLFGNGETINQQGFERLIKTLQLDQLLWSKINNSAVNLSPPVKLAATGVQNDTNTTCMDHRDLIKAVSRDPVITNSTLNSTGAVVSIDGAGFRSLCPVLLYQMVAPSSAERHGCIKVAPNAAASLQHGQNESQSAATQIHVSNMGSVWLYSILSVIIISACGLLGVLVIPIMQQHFYQHLIQFLVALAVGTLAGDALLHLLPHAMMSHSHSHEDAPHGSHSADDAEAQHELNMWRGFVAMLGLIFFFFMEKCLTLCAEWRKQRQLRKNKFPPRVRVMRETDTASTTSVGCKHKYSSYPYCYGVIATETQDDHHQHPGNHQPPNSVDTTHNNTTTTILNDLESDAETGHHTHGHHHQEANQNQCSCQSNTNNVIKCSESSKMLTEIPGNNTPRDQVEINKALNNQLSESDSYTVILRTHENKHHGHSHTHGHVHSAPKSLSSVAWMVVMGDGLHNFTDGMAIGAAFAGSLAGGFSTAVAVFCHELPHEIGDFAVLLKAGMTARQAIFYNMLSSVLCLFGMVLGVFLGNSDEASGWMFACAAGMFLYIALVDMIPELTTSHSKEGGSLLQCILQFFGLLVGLGIMLVIALYEHDLKRLFED